jgi:leucine-rich repeat protein SHOC2
MLTGIKSRIFQLVFAIAGVVLFSTSAQAQLLDTLALDTVKTYTSLESALKNPEQVYRLKLSKQKLQEFPMEILKLKNLNVLDLGKNRIKVVPAGIKELKYLQDVSMPKNKMVNFPLALCELVHLKRLNLSVNQIESLPKQIGQLTELTVLDLWSNNIGTYPTEMNQLTSLKEMDLRVINLNYKEQKRISGLLPNTKIHFSPGCNCGN